MLRLSSQCLTHLVRCVRKNDMILHIIEQPRHTYMMGPNGLSYPIEAVRKTALKTASHVDHM